MAFSGGTCSWHTGMILAVMLVKRHRERKTRQQELLWDPTAKSESEQ